jgi:hypothetical protein
MPRMNILSAYVTRLWNFREEMLWFNVHEDKGTKLERKSKDSKQLHQGLSRKCDSRSETSAENLGELYYTAL